MNPHFVIATGQFEIAHESSPQEVAGRIRRFAYEPVAFWTPRVVIEWCLSLFGRQGFAACASQSEAVTVAVGFSPRGGSPQTGRRGATLEGIDWLLGSGVAPRRTSFPPLFRGLKPTATITLSLRDFAKSEIRLSSCSHQVSTR